MRLWIAKYLPDIASGILTVEMHGLIIMSLTEMLEEFLLVWFAWKEGAPRDSFGSQPLVNQALVERSQSIF